jgi:caa(3)-type oxidase subunit IV
MANPSHGGDHHNDAFKAYMTVAVALSVFTASSFLFNFLARSGTISHFMSFVLILAVAIVKAGLVGWIFMHLKWDWRLLYFLLIPAFIMATMMIIVLLPDVLLGASRDAAEAHQIASEMQ